MIRLLETDKYPYIFTLIVAAIAFQFNYLVESAFKVPVIEYVFEHNQRDTIIGGTNYLQRKLLISNISSDKLIGNLKIQLKYRADENIKLEFPDMDPIPPARRMAGNDPMYRYNLLHYPIGSLQPSTSYELRFFTTSKDKNPNLFYENDSAALLAKRSAYTFLLKNHVTVNFVIMIFLIGLLTYYFVKLKRTQKKTRT